MAGVSCRDLKGCDWSTYEKQLIQIGISQEMLDRIRELFPWLQRKSHEDSLLAAMRWLDGKRDRERMIEISETLNGRVFTYFSASSSMQDSGLKSLHRMDSINGLYYSASLSASSRTASAIDSLHAYLSGVFGDGRAGDYPASCLVPGNQHLIECGGGGNPGGGGSGKETDLSGVESGIEGLGRSLDGIGSGIDGIGDGIAGLGALLGRIDSTLSAGGDIAGILEGAFSECDGDGCGSYDGVGDGAFGGLDTSGLGRARWDSLLSPPGSNGLRDSAEAFAGSLRESTATPFRDGMACPVTPYTTANPCEVFGGSCVFSICDERFHLHGRHVFEWLGVVLEFLSWVVLLVRVA
ncbi:MAG: hypothetical protein LBH25_04680 [Fibromonadaceae bacterium]|nr:hypothetical protein [Fibromonadaceae bacterium]